MFYDLCGERYREILKAEEGAWLISYDEPGCPRFVSEEALINMAKIEPPRDVVDAVEKTFTDGQAKRQAMVQELLLNTEYISNAPLRNQKMKEIAKQESTTFKRIQRLYFRSLAGRSLVETRKPKEKEITEDQKNFSWAIKKFYFSAKKHSLRDAYDLMLLGRYTDQQGKLIDGYPSLTSFRHFYYDKNYHKSSRVKISRGGLSNYQRNERPLFGSGTAWKDKIGAFQMDATLADIYLVSRLDKSVVIGRPNVYMAVDTASQLIAGIYVGLEAGEQAVIDCLANAASDKVAYCAMYGIDISKEEWPNTGLPGEIITDQGKEFIGNRMTELAMKYGIEFEALPPFRPDEKGLVEKTFDLIQQRYKPLLRGKGVIEEDAQERWATDYRAQAVLTLEDYTKIIIRCILYFNSKKVLEGGLRKSCEPIAAGIWNHYDSLGKSMMIPIDGEDLHQFELPREKASLSRRGIHRNGLWYVNEHYSQILEKRKCGEQVMIAYDRNDITMIYLMEGTEMIPFVLPDYLMQYAGASEEEYACERERHKGKKKEFSKADTDGRVQLLLEISEIADNAEHSVKGRQNGESIKENRRRELV